MPPRTKKKVADDTWSKIIEKAITEAEAVDCDGKVFARGLDTMVDILISRRDEAFEEFDVSDDDEFDDELGPTGSGDDAEVELDFDED